MPKELFANTATTILSIAMTDTVSTTLTVASSTLFPAAVTGISQFRITINSELLIVTNVTGKVWTVIRGAEGSLAAPHLNASPVTHILTAGGIDNSVSTAQYAAFGTWETPEKYGCAASYGAATDDTAAVQAALTAATTSGFPVLLSRMYKVPNGGLTTTGSVTIQGVGGMLFGDPVNSLSPLGRSGFRCATGTASGLTLSNAPGSVLEKFAVLNDVSVAPTAGTGIKFVGDGSSSQSNISGVAVLGFYDLMETSGVFFTIDRCRFYDAVRNSLFLNNSGANYSDHGDLGITNNVFAQNYKTWDAASAIRWRAGGGIRIVGNKFLGGATVGNPSWPKFGIPIDIMAADGVSTGDVTCTGNSISNFTAAAIRVGLETSLGTANFINVSITGNLINVGWGSAKAMLLGAPTPGLCNNIRGVHVADNIIDNCPGGGIFAYNMKSLTIGVNTWQTMPAGVPLISLGDAPDSGIGLYSVDIARQNRQESAGDLILDMRRVNSADGLSGVVSGHEFTQNVYTNTVGTWVTLGWFDLPLANGGCADLEVLLTGYDYDNGPVYARYRRLLSKVSGAATVTVTADGADVTAGAGAHYAMQFLTTTQNRVIVQVQLTAGSLTFWGKAHIIAHGDIALSHKGI